MPNVRSPQAIAYQRMYHTPAWRQRRARQLAREPWCAYCAREGRQMRASVADHVLPHRGNAELFWTGRLQSLCMACHSANKQQVEKIGYSSNIGVDGWPLDAKHYANTGRMPQQHEVQVHNMKYKY